MAMASLESQRHGTPYNWINDDRRKTLRIFASTTGIDFHDTATKAILSGPMAYNAVELGRYEFSGWPL